MNSTMVSPIHILLFGAQKIDYADSLIVLDDWFVKFKTTQYKCDLALKSYFPLQDIFKNGC